LGSSLVGFVLWSVPASTQDRFKGKVVAVADGDTISAMRDARAVRVRLEGIDCPERGRDFCDRAKQFTSDQTLGKEVTVDVRDLDRYGRLVARVSVAGEDVSLALRRPVWRGISRSALEIRCWRKGAHRTDG
jgi:endonuclease YncB( thermonuclease family)